MLILLNWLAYNLKKLIYLLKGNCKYDFLKIYSLYEDGKVANNHGIYCDSQIIDHLIESSTNEIGINFKSDNSVSKTGFSLIFTTG